MPGNHLFILTYILAQMLGILFSGIKISGEKMIYREKHENHNREYYDYRNSFEYSYCHDLVGFS